MFEPVKKRFHKIVLHYNKFNLKEIFIFATLLIIFTLLGYFWKHFFDYKIFGVHVLEPVYVFLTRYIVLSSYWLLKTIFAIPISYVIDTSRLYFSDVSFLYVYHGCSGLKEMAMFLFLILFFPGRWLMKLWFIPVSLVLIYLMAILRIVFLGLVYKYQPTWFHFIHVYLFNLLFFLLFFIMWLAWIKWFSGKKPLISEPDLKPNEY